MASTYDVGTKAWQPDAAEGWVASELVNKSVDGSKVKLDFKLENGEVCMPIDLRLTSDANWHRQKRLKSLPRLFKQAPTLRYLL